MLKVPVDIYDQSTRRLFKYSNADSKPLRTLAKLRPCIKHGPDKQFATTHSKTITKSNYFNFNYISHITSNIEI